MLSNMTQFNGEYGCEYCLNPGFSVRKGNGTAHVYDVPLIPFYRRDRKTNLAHAKQAVACGKSVMGV